MIPFPKAVKKEEPKIAMPEHKKEKGKYSKGTDGDGQQAFVISCEQEGKGSGQGLACNEHQQGENTD